MRYTAFALLCAALFLSACTTKAPAPTDDCTACQAVTIAPPI
jgi:PBP1b-binding outer membrane lipoprotein LpoB